MKKSLLTLVILISLTTLKAQYVTIPDSNFAAWLQSNIPSAMIGNQMDTISLAVTTRTNISVENIGIGDLTGVQYFDSLKVLDCGNGYLMLNPNSLTSLPALPSTLDTLICGRNVIMSLPILPNTLKFLNCYSNALYNIPTLPNGLRYLNCGENMLSNIPSLPNTLTELYFNVNLISQMPVLPNGLTDLGCAINQLTQLPILPSQLNFLNCSYNSLNNLPLLPSSLKHLFCNSNNLSNLPNLPIGLMDLVCSNNNITNLPNLPSNLAQLLCDRNHLTTLPPLTPIMVVFDCSYNYIACFDPFGPILSFNISNNPFTCLPNYISAMDSMTLTYPLCMAGNPYACNYAEGIVGYTYKDNNTSCIKDAGDTGLKNLPVKIYDNSGNLISKTYTALNGVYGFPQTSNTYAIEIDTMNLPLVSSCNYPGIDSTVTVALLDTNINFAFGCTPSFDVGVQSFIVNGNIFPGQTHTLNVVAGDMTHWYNLNCATGISGSLSFSVIGPVNYAGPAAGALIPSVSGNIYTYTIPDFGIISNSDDFKLLFTVDTAALAGDAICINAHVFPIVGDNMTGNNSNKSCYNVTNSHDPNIKEVYPVDVQPGFNDWLTYTIHFQNTGNAPAYNIRLADTLDAILDLETFQVINYSHYNNTSVNGNVLNVRFPNIMLPDSTSNPSGSIGYIQYRIKPKATWVAPYKIKNTAYIYFDFNAPIVTNTTYNSILDIATSIAEGKESIASVYPNPTNGLFTIELSIKEKQNLQLFDMAGHVVLSQTIENGKATIDANYLVAGIYNISIKGNNSVTNQKLVVVK